MIFRLIPNVTVPWEVYRYLLPGEQKVITVRRHPFALIPAACLPAASVTAFALSAAGVIPGGVAVPGIFGVLSLLSCYLFYHLVRAWLRAYFACTTSRIMLVNWLRGYQLLVIPIDRASDMKYIRTLIPGRVVGYGSFLIRNAGPRGRGLKIRYLPYPDQLYLEVTGLIFQSNDD